MSLPGLSSPAQDKTAHFPKMSMRLRQKMPRAESSGETKGRLLFYHEIRKLHVSDQAEKDIDVAQHTGKGLTCSWQLEMPAEYSRDNEYLLYGYR